MKDNIEISVDGEILVDIVLGDDALYKEWNDALKLPRNNEYWSEPLWVLITEASRLFEDVHGYAPHEDDVLEAVNFLMRG